jgi:hypothetical protein
MVILLLRCDRIPGKSAEQQREESSKGGLKFKEGPGSSDASCFRAVLPPFDSASLTPIKFPVSSRVDVL